MADDVVTPDSTLPGVAYDATHITLGVSDLNQGVASNDMAAMLPLLGNMEIEVLEAGGGGAAKAKSAK